MEKQSLVLIILMITMCLNVIVSVHYIHTETKRFRRPKSIRGME